jgi:xanthine dehydrogenase accessory factor
MSTTADLLDALVAAVAAGRQVTLATVVAVHGSAPLPIGSAMVVIDDGTVLGAVSGGCVESTVHDEARSVAATGVPRLTRFGPAEHPYEIGLTCGGSVSIFVEPVRHSSLPGWRGVAERCRSGRPATRTVVVAGPDDALGRETFAADGGGSSSGVRVRGDVEVFVQVWPAAPRMIIVGADGLAGALSDQARLLGYAVTVCDPRPVFATPQRFPAAEVVRAWPDRYLAAEAAAGRCDDTTVVCVLTHDERVDVPVIMVALGLPELAFVGAAGSRATCTDRERRLLAAGCLAKDLVRLRTPLGLDLGGKHPSEAAVSIAAEIVAERHARRGAAPARDHGSPARAAGSCCRRRFTPYPEPHWVKGRVNSSELV